MKKGGDPELLSSSGGTCLDEISSSDNPKVVETF